MIKKDIIIIGAGVAGVPLAVGLKKQGYDVLLVEKMPKTAHLFKGEYLQPAALDTALGLGFDDLLKQKSSQLIRELRFRDLDANGDAIADLTMAYPKNKAALAISHYDLIETLRVKAKEILGDDFIMGASLEPFETPNKEFFHNPKFVMKAAGREDSVVSARWVVGCDGRQSMVRKWLGGPGLPKNGPVVLGVEPEMIVGLETPGPLDLAHRYEVVRTYKKGTVSTFTLGSQGKRIYYSSPEIEGNMKKQWTESLQEISAQINPMFNIGEITDTTKIAAFPAFTAEFMTSFPGRFLLCGDSAAVTTPFGGQGMTAAIEHVRALLNNFNWNTDNQSIINRQKSEYQGAIEQSFKRINVLNLGLYFLFFSRSPMMKTLSSHVVKTWQRQPELKQQVMNLFAGLEQETPSLPRLMTLWGLTPKQAFSVFKGLASVRFSK